MSYKRVSNTKTGKRKKSSQNQAVKKRFTQISKAQSNKIVEFFKELQTEFGNTIVYFDANDLAKHSTYNDGINWINVYKNGVISYSFLDANSIYQQGSYTAKTFDALMSRLKRFRAALRKQGFSKRKYATVIERLDWESHQRDNW